MASKIAGHSNKPWDELPVLPMDKVNTLMLSTAPLGISLFFLAFVSKRLFAHRSLSEWEITVTLHQPGHPPVQSMTSRVAVKQVLLSSVLSLSVPCILSLVNEHGCE